MEAVPVGRLQGLFKVMKNKPNYLSANISQQGVSERALDGIRACPFAQMIYIT